jgi:YegS/Rv2252/BmrU family lipid kinase
MKRKVHVVINPASGREKPILHILNRVFKQADVEWDISLTKARGDAERFAREAAAAGADVVAAYGGDGTVMEVAQGVLGSPVPLAIFPGGSANLMAVELGIPKGLEKATQIAGDPESPTRQVDVCLLGEKTFLLRVGMGFSARKVEDADRDLKDRYGVMAYSIASVKALKDSKPVHFLLKLDDEPVEADGISCQIDNAGNMGIRGVKLSKDILVDDGLMDVLIVGLHRGERVVQHWQARQIEIEADPPQPVQVDGEMTGNTPVSAGIMPGALKVLVRKAG